MPVTTLHVGSVYTVTVVNAEGVTTTTAAVEQLADGLVWFSVNGYPCEPVPVAEVLDAALVRE